MPAFPPSHFHYSLRGARRAGIFALLARRGHAFGGHQKLLGLRGSYGNYVWLPEQVGPQHFPRAHVITAELTVPQNGAEGVIMLKLFVNDQPAGEGQVKRSLFRHGLEPFEVGRDSITPIDPAYKDRGTFEFTGTIDKVSFEIEE
jgi:hypothetical protein